MVKHELVEKIASDAGLTSSDELISNAIISFLKDKKRQINIDILQILDRYRVKTSKVLEEKIASGEIPEHPAWEDLITLENLEQADDNIQQHIASLQ